MCLREEREKKTRRRSIRKKKKKKNTKKKKTKKKKKNLTLVPGSQSWQTPHTKGASPSPRCRHICTAVNQGRQLVFIGGYGQGSAPLREIFILHTGR